MAFWDADLTTRMGAESAADNGGLACWFKAGFLVIGAVIFRSSTDFSPADGQFIFAAMGIEFVVYVIAGFRLRAGKGAFWGIAAAVLLVLALIDTLMSGMFGGGIIINIIFLVVIVQGIRGAFALRNDHFSDEDIEVFD